MRCPGGRRSGGAHLGRRALASVYGFIMVYLLVMASLEAVAVSVSSSQAVQEAAQRVAQVGQTRTLERLSVSEGGGGVLTVRNEGLVPSTVAFLLLRGSTTTTEVPVGKTIPPGSSLSLEEPPGGSSALDVAVVTSLGDVFQGAPGAAAPPTGSWTKVLESGVGGPGVDAQVYQGPYSEGGRLFLASGSNVTSFSSSTGARQWSFDAGEGEVTDVLPLSDGTVYVSDGYYGDQFTSEVYRLSSSGTLEAGYTMRLLRLYTTVEVQYPSGGLPPYPVGSQPVQKGDDGSYAFYDGWFLYSGGLSATEVPADTFNLAGSGDGAFYLYTTSPNPGGFGCSAPRGNVVTVLSYDAGASAGVSQAWSSSVFFNACDEYPNQVLASAAGPGVFACLFSQTYWTQPNFYGGPYTGSNPLLAVFSSSSGALLRASTLDSFGYTSVATDGTSVYLALPSTDQVEVVGASPTGGGSSFHDIGFPASTLVWAYGSLFAVSPSRVGVYNSSLGLERTIDLSPFSLYSLSDSKPLEQAMSRPSFLVLNSTTFAALVRNATGFGTLVEGDYLR